MLPFNIGFTFLFFHSIDNMHMQFGVCHARIECFVIVIKS